MNGRSTWGWVGLVVLITLVAMVAPCCMEPRYTVHTENVEPAVRRVLERVEHYAAADSALAGEARAGVLADVATVRGLLGQASVDQRVLAGPLRRVCDKHDAWVLADPLLDPLSRSVFLETTVQVRGVLQPPD